MEKNILHIIILLLIFSCKGKTNKTEKNQVLEQKDILVIDRNKSSIKSTVQIKPKTNNNENEIGIVYVTSENGISYQEKPDIYSKKLGKFEFGSKLSVIEKTGIKIEKKGIKGEWIKVISKRYKWHKGYIFSGFVIDSSKADFSKIPVDISYVLSLIKNNVNEIIEYNRIDLKFSKTNISEFNKYLVSNNVKKTNDTNVKPFKSVGNPQQGGYFILKIKERLLKFPCGENYSRPCYIYEGFNKYFNAYSIGRVGEGIYETFYIDKDNGSIFQVNSPYDDGNYAFYVSPNNKKLAFTSSIDYERFAEFYDYRSVIIIYDINNINRFSNIKNAYIYSSKEWEISNLVWIDDNSFILEVYNKTKKDSHGMEIPIKYEYLITTLK